MWGFFHFFLESKCYWNSCDEHHLELVMVPLCPQLFLGQWKSVLWHFHDEWDSINEIFQSHYKSRGKERQCTHIQKKSPPKTPTNIWLKVFLSPRNWNAVFTCTNEQPQYYSFTYACSGKELVATRKTTSSLNSNLKFEKSCCWYREYLNFLSFFFQELMMHI